MKENIFRTISLIMALLGAFAYLTGELKLLPISFSAAFIAAAFIAFALYAIGGSKLLAQLPFTKILNDNIKSFLTTGRDSIK